MPGGGVRIRAVLFDLGGTLIDERDFTGWVELARRLFLDFTPEELGYAYTETEGEDDLRAPAADGRQAHVAFWQRVLSRASGTDVGPETAARFVDARHAQIDPPIALYSDVRRCLDQLRGERRRLGLVSNSQSEASVRRILDRAGILDYFERVVSSGSEGVAKPDPEIFLRAVRRLELPPEQTLYVGNLPRTDARAAQAAGLHSVWLHRDGMGLGDDPPEITSLLEVPLVVRQLERGVRSAAAAPR